jgi:hypothetical protein
MSIRLFVAHPQPGLHKSPKSIAYMQLFVSQLSLCKVNYSDNNVQKFLLRNFTKKCRFCILGNGLQYPDTWQLRQQTLITQNVDFSFFAYSSQRCFPTKSRTCLTADREHEGKKKDLVLFKRTQGLKRCDIK